VKKMALAVFVVIASVGLFSFALGQESDLTPIQSFDQLVRGWIDTILIWILEIVIVALLVWAAFLWVLRTVGSIIEPTNQTLGLPKGAISSLLALVLASVLFISMLVGRAYLIDRTFLLWLIAVYGGVIAVYVVSRIFSHSSE